MVGWRVGGLVFVVCLVCRFVGGSGVLLGRTVGASVGCLVGWRFG